MPQIEYKSLNGYDIVIDQSESILYDSSLKKLFIDCITHDVVLKPVFTTSGNVYELDALRKWFFTSSVDPASGKEINIGQINAIPVINTFVALLLLEETSDGILYHVPKIGILSLFALGQMLFPLTQADITYNELNEQSYATICNTKTKAVVATLRPYVLTDGKIYIGQKYYCSQIDNILDYNWENARAYMVNLEGFGELTKANNFSCDDCYFGLVEKIELSDLFKCVFSKRSVHHNAIIMGNGLIAHNKFNNIESVTVYAHSLMHIYKESRFDISTYINSFAEFFNFAEETNFEIQTNNRDCQIDKQISYDNIQNESVIDLNKVKLTFHDKISNHSFNNIFIKKEPNTEHWDFYVIVNSTMHHIKTLYENKVLKVQNEMGTNYLDTIRNKITISSFVASVPVPHMDNTDILLMKQFYKIPFIHDDPHDTLWGLDLSGLIIKNLVMSEKDLKGYLFVGTKFVSCIFINCNFMVCKFILSQFEAGSKFIDCEFKECAFLETNVTRNSANNIFYNSQMDDKSNQRVIDNINTNKNI